MSDEHTTLPLDEIHPYPRNNRKHPPKQIAFIADAIKRWGFNGEIVVDENHVILSGHGRLLAAKKAGLKEVRVHVKHGLSEEDKIGLRVADNESSRQGEMDFANVNYELGILQETYGIALEDWGLDQLGDIVSSFEDAGGDYTPQVEGREITDEDINRADANLKNKFTQTKSQLEVCCPECAHTFMIDG